MSIIGAMVLGGALGGAGAGFVFNYTKSEYEKEISEIEGYLDALSEHYKEMVALRDRVPEFWHDTRGETVYRELGKTIDETWLMMEDLKGYLRTLRTVVTELDNAGGVMTQTIEDLVGALSAGLSG